MGLWMTIESCEMALRGTDISYQYTIVMNGQSHVCRNLRRAVDTLKGAEKLAQFVVHPAPMSPPSARQLGTVFGDGKYLFFLDNHCLVEKDYFTRAVSQLEANPKIALLHSTTRFHSEDNFHFEYTLQLEKNFWASNMTAHPKDKRNPYPIACGGHGGFAARRDVWQKVGGYWGGFINYGGEETYLDLKLWMLGYEVWLDPKMIHYHYAGDRDYPRHYTDDYFRNMMMCANVIGGEHWMDTVYDTFAAGSKSGTGKTMFDLYIEAAEQSQKHAKELAALRTRTLDEQLDWFKTNEIPH
jgi:hypothetical protein